VVERREFIMLVGGAAAWPLVVRAQQAGKMPVIGYLNSTSPNTFEAYTVAFRGGLQDAGYIEGKTIAIEYRWAEGKNERLPSLAADLVSHQVAVIAATGATAGVRAAMATTKTIPIVFITGADPVTSGLVASFNRPGGNVTGVSFLANTLAPKQLELLREVVPNISLVGVLVNPTNPALAEVALKDVQVAARTLGLRFHAVHAATERDFAAAFESLVQLRANALIIGADGFFTSRIALLAELATRHALPAISSYREFATSGGLLSYGTSLTDAYRQVGRYTAKILAGEKPAELPVIQPTKFELVVNLTTAKRLGLAVPVTLQVAADEVIE
jgi:putative tryptophan/tyrosine transport system substrate-binding protein